MKHYLTRVSEKTDTFACHLEGVWSVVSGAKILNILGKLGEQ